MLWKVPWSLGCSSFVCLRWSHTLAVQACQVVPHHHIEASCNQAFLFVFWRRLSDREGAPLAGSVTSLVCVLRPL